MLPGPKAPKTYNCVNCGRVVEVAKYSGMYPKQETSSEHVHIIKSSDLPSFSLFCTCGHYTIVEHRSSQ